jgi:hypothetical protein
MKEIQEGQIQESTEQEDKKGLEGCSVDGSGGREVCRSRSCC